MLRFLFIRERAFVSTESENNFYTAQDCIRKNFFAPRDRSQPQRNPEVRARDPKIIDMLSQQVAATPLTAPLAGVKSATRIVQQWIDSRSQTNKKLGVRL
jgi:hypothetical protein